MNLKHQPKLRAAVGLSVLLCLLCVGCGTAIKKSGTDITDPTERGCMYIATALVVSAIIRGVMNK